MKKEERNAFVKCVIMLACSLGWIVLTYTMWASPYQTAPIKALCTVVSIGWLVIFIIRVVQWRSIKQMK